MSAVVTVAVTWKVRRTRSSVRDLHSRKKEKILSAGQAAADAFEKKCVAQLDGLALHPHRGTRLKDAPHLRWVPVNAARNTYIVYMPVPDDGQAVPPLGIYVPGHGLVRPNTGLVIVYGIPRGRGVPRSYP